MRIDMKLFTDWAFDAVKAGVKTVELRICDPKRAAIKLDDEILFTGKNGDSILVKVTGLCHFTNFQELFKVIPPVLAGFNGGDSIEYATKWMYSIYSDEEIKKYGVLGIVVQPI